MTRLFLIGQPPEWRDGTRFVADFDGPDAPIIAVGARHGHEDGMHVTAVDFDKREYRFENDAGTIGGRRPFPSRWLEVDSDGGDQLPTDPPVLVIHDDDSVTRVPFVPFEAQS